MKHLKLLIFVLLGVMLAITPLLGACTEEEAPPAEEEEEEPPEWGMVNWGLISGVEGTAYAATVAMFNPLEEAVGLESTAVPIPGSVANLSALRDGLTHLTQVGCSTAVTAFCGTEEFAEAGWEPLTDLRLVWLMSVSDMGIAVRADSDIQTIYDLPGKIMGWCSTSASSIMKVEALCAFLEEDLDDFEKVDCASHGAMGGLVRDGLADFAFVGTSSSIAYEIEASPHGLRWLSIPEDEEGWARVMEVAPIYVRLYCESGTGAAIPDEGVYVMGSPSAYITLSSVDPELIYTIVKGLTLAYEEFKDLHPILWQASIERSSDPNCMPPGIPWHEGVIEWLKEAGYYTPELEMEQESRLQAIGATK